jgi:UDP-N-acetyl-D-glucosamine dehydrogenase
MRIGIVGLGYVGLPLAVAFAEAGCDVVGIDVDAGKVSALRAGRSHIEDVPSEALAGVLERCLFSTRFVELH